MRFRGACLTSVFFAVSGCASTLPPPPRAPTTGAGWRYEVLVGHGGRELSVEARLPSGSEATLAVDKGALAYVHDLRVEKDGRWIDVPIARDKSDDTIAIDGCASGCRFRYRYALADAAAGIHDVDRATAIANDLFEAPPSTFLLHPTRAPAGETFRFHVTTPKGVTFASGVLRARDGEAGAYEAPVVALAKGPYSIVGDAHVETHGAVEVVRPNEGLTLADTELARWVDAGEQAITSYYGRFPVERVLVVVAPVKGDTVKSGRTMGNGGASIVVSVGAAARGDALVDDWVLTHEMVHLALPSVEQPHHWLEEGLATYVERIARARSGVAPAEEIWKDLFYGLPLGQPAPGDRGLDRSHSWGRTYWGGALYCLVADVEIRQRTHNQKSLDDALRAIVARGGSIEVAWPLEKTLDVADSATGVPVMHDLYARMGERPMRVDLDALWSRLGVTVEGEQVIVNDEAPVASVRKALLGL